MIILVIKKEQNDFIMFFGTLKKENWIIIETLLECRKLQEMKNMGNLFMTHAGH